MRLAESSLRAPESLRRRTVAARPRKPASQLLTRTASARAAAPRPRLQKPALSSVTPTASARATSLLPGRRASAKREGDRPPPTA
jgi:hypothetical protein